MTEKIYPSIKSVILLCLVFIALQFLAGSIAEVILLIADSGGLNITGNIETFLNMIAQLSVFFIIFRFLVLKSYVPIIRFHKKGRLNLKVGFIFLLLFYSSSVILSEINTVFYYFLPMPDFLVELFYQKFMLDSFVLSMFLLTVLPAVLEEILFRGFILFGLRRHYSARKSIIVSSLLFGIVHLNPWQFMTAFLLGLLFAWVALKTKSIILPVIGHFFNNMMALIAARYFDMKMNPGENPEFQSPEIVITALLLCILGFYLFHNYFRRDYDKNNKTAKTD